MAQAGRSFEGFTAEMWGDTVRIPAAFFTDLLPMIDHAGELRVLLFCFWALPQKGGEFPYLRREDFLSHQPLMAALESEAMLDESLAKGLERRTLLWAEVRIGEAAEMLYFVNTPRGKLAVQQIEAGEFVPGSGQNVIEILPERPTIYRLYEANIGPLTPMIAEELKDMAGEFPAEWIAEAFREAVRANARKLKYIRAVLERWQTEGKAVPQSSEERFERDGKHYVTGKYSDFINH
ncbi:MAG: DnaD domain protein [bacterium]|nr:DnaD domain protein [bacterium]